MKKIITIKIDWVKYLKAMGFLLVLVFYRKLPDWFHLIPAFILLIWYVDLYDKANKKITK